jgi:hypothetical protein
MCFSATASFVAAGTLGAIGIAAVHKAKLSPIRPLAYLPIFFGLQQALEGIVWLTLNLPSATLWWNILQGIGIYGYVFFAAIFWPIWIPYALYKVETNTHCRMFLYHIMILEIIMGVLYLMSWHFTPLNAININCHISYPIFDAPVSWLNYTSTSIMVNFGLKFVKYFMQGVYLLGSTMSFFYSSLPFAKLIGMLAIIGYIVARVGYALSFASVWCFFAAAISVLTYYVVVQYQKRHVSK